MASKQFTIYKLHFTSPLHISDCRNDYGVSQHTIASDTMYAALTSTLAKMGQKIPENGDLGCTISSLFPYYQKEAEGPLTLFFPKPLISLQPHLKNVSEAKRIKKVAWIDLSYFERMLAGDPLFDDGADIENINDEYLSTEPIGKKFISSKVTQRVSVMRDYSGDAKPFFMDRVFFAGQSGLFFLCDGDTASIDKAMPLLQLEGIGTDRSIGNGFFEYKKDTITITIPDKGSRGVSLSIFVPESKEQLSKILSSKTTAYELQRRGGWITTPPNNTIRKNSIYAFSAGSVFGGFEFVSTAGKIIDLRPSLTIVEHPIWRCGRSIIIPMK